MTQHRRPLLGLAGLCAVALTAGCGKALPSDTGAGGTTVAKAKIYKATTDPAKGDTGSVTWATYRSVTSLDPIVAFDYPENTVITSMCESLVRQQPDGSLVPGIASKIERPDPKTVVFTVRPGVKFWDGKPVTAEDVAYDLQRAADPKAGGFYSVVMNRVTSIKATSASQVTVKLSKPDYWLDGELSQMAGVVYEKAFAEKAGKKFGAPGAGTMCTGPFKLGAWQPGAKLTAVRNDDYWNPKEKAKASQIVFRGVPDDTSITSGLITGAINGSFQFGISTLDQLKRSPAVTVTPGPSYAVNALVISSLKGVLGDVRVRQALSMAVDRAGLVQTAFKGAAQIPHDLANPGSWGYGRSVFQDDWTQNGPMPQNIAAAKALVKLAGATGKTLTIGSTSETASINYSAIQLREAATRIGLKARIKNVSAQSFISFFTDAKFRAGVDGFPTVNYPDYADPAAFYNTLAMPGGTQNYDGFSDTQITEAMNAARSEADPTQRAIYVTQAGDRIRQLLPWIPLTMPDNVLITSSKLTGAPTSFSYMGGPWANTIGSK